MNIVGDFLVILIIVGGIIATLAMSDFVHNFLCDHFPSFAIFWDKMLDNMSNGL